VGRNKNCQRAFNHKSYRDDIFILRRIKGINGVLGIVMMSRLEFIMSLMPIAMMGVDFNAF
jgi:hypothetical protein